MGTIRKIGNKWRAEVCVKGKRSSMRFERKTEAMAWIAKTEAEPERALKQHTLREALQRYATEESPLRRGEKWEIVRLSAFQTPMHKTLPLDKTMDSINPDDLAIWRDARLKSVSPGTVLREMKLLSSVFETARRSWRWCSSNPTRDTRKPPEPKHREVVITANQTRTMLEALTYSPTHKPTTVTHTVALAFLVALRTGMRAGEICALTWADIKMDKKQGIGFARLKTSKTGKGRDVPLTRKSVRLVEKMQQWDSTSVFALKPQTLDALFRKARTKAGLEGFTFHDSRHTAATRIAGRMKSNKDVTAQQALLDLCKIFGWTKTDRALTYYNPDPLDMVKRL